MLSTLFKWAKRLFWASAVFFGLYYFGDFNINEVNVRDSLQRAVPPDKIAAARRKAFQLAKAAYVKVDERTGFSSKLKSILGLGSAEHMDKISDKDQEKMMDLLKKNMETALDPEQQEQTTKRLQETVESISGGSASGSASP